MSAADVESTVTRKHMKRLRKRLNGMHTVTISELTYILCSIQRMNVCTIEGSAEVGVFAPSCG